MSAVLLFLLLPHLTGCRAVTAPGPAPHQPPTHPPTHLLRSTS
ncbi:hypothetical protein [Streptomyces aidingensis]|nr:hypothetical protein [Streptomyces aidingensis]